MKKLRLFLSKTANYLLLLLNILAIVWLAVCKWASVADPAGHPATLSLFSLTTTLAYLANIFFVIYWLCFTRKKLRLFLSLIPIIILWSTVRPLIGFHYLSRNNMKAAEGDLKIMTWNVHLFNLGEWVRDKNAQTKIIEFIKKENPDIICLEEYYRNPKAPGLPYTDIIRQLGYPYVSFSLQNQMMKKTLTIHAGPEDIIDVGNVIFSKFPLSNITDQNLGTKFYSMLSADVAIDSSHHATVNVIHLTSVGFGKEQFALIHDVKTKGLQESDNRESDLLLNKLKYAFAQRALLADRIDALKQSMKYPIIICGDFNDVPSSYVYNKIKGTLTDPFVKKGTGFGRTYRNIFPTLRIDYILLDGKYFNVIGYSRPRAALSDHFPVIVNLTFKKT